MAKKIMQKPTTDQLETAMEVLSKLRDRLNAEAQHSISHMPKTQMGVHYSRDIWLQAVEQTGRIAALSNQLKNWRDELPEQRDQILFCPPEKIRRPHFRNSLTNLWLWSKNLLAAKWRHRQMGLN